MKLTKRKIDGLTVKTGQKDCLIFDDVQRGLAVRVTKSGGRTYLAQYTQHGQKHRVPLGACAALSLTKARKAAATIMGEVAKGNNPTEDRKKAVALARQVRDRLTLDALIERWKQLYLSQRRPRYAAEATRALRFAFKRYLDRAAEELDRATVVRILDGQRGTAIASRTAAYGRAVYGWAIKRGAVSQNPFASLPALSSPPKRDRVLTDEELSRVWRAAGDVSAPFGQIIRLLILTGQRREEVAGMGWTELSDDLATWTIPGARTKNSVPHIVPLSEPARGLIRELLPDDPKKAKAELAERRERQELVCPGKLGTTFSGWSKSKADLDKRSKASAWRLHDLRRTLATGLQRLGVRLEVTEAVLNHVSGSRAGIVGVYQRHDWAAEKRAALDAFAAIMMALAAGKAPRDNAVRATFR